MELKVVLGVLKRHFHDSVQVRVIFALFRLALLTIEVRNVLGRSEICLSI